MVSSTRPGRPAWAIAVAGGGPPGLLFALATARALGAAARVTVADPALATERPDRRCYALSPGVVAMLEVLDLWPTLAPGAAPIGRMRITDGRVEDAVRPDYLRFAGRDGRPLAWTVEAGALGSVLRDAARAAGVAFAPAGVARIEPADAASLVRLSDGGTLRAALVVAADGGRSPLREAAGIGWVGRGYGQVGVTGTVRHTRDADGLAIQHFLPSGPFALLPLVPDAAGYRASMIWTERPDRAAAILALPPADLAREVAARCGPDLGTVTLDGTPQSFPLAFGLARRFVAGRLALVGDAAHVIHPLAGQGLNLGLADAAALAERVVGAVRLGLDPGAPSVLARYERDRRADAVRLAALTDGLNRLFSNDLLPVRWLRDLGLGLVDRAGGLKDALLEAAAGEGARAPRLLRGLPL